MLIYFNFVKINKNKQGQFNTNEICSNASFFSWFLFMCRRCLTLRHVIGYKDSVYHQFPERHQRLNCITSNETSVTMRYIYSAMYCDPLGRGRSWFFVCFFCFFLSFGAVSNVYLFNIPPPFFFLKFVS